jgi:uncharacterized protein YqjF (DUF2071 family)
LVERYLLYAEWGGGGLRQGRVSHPPYALRSATIDSFDENLSAAAGLHGPRNGRIVHYSPGVAVTIHAPIGLG